MDELALINAAQRGDIDAFNRLVLAYQSGIYNFACRLIGDSEVAADAVQEAFIAAYRKMGGYRGGSFRAWLLRITTNACYDELRRRKRRPALSIEDLTAEGSPDPDHPALVADPDEGPEAQALQNDLSRAIQDCLDGLPRAYRLVAIMSDIQGYDYREIADAAGLSLGTVKSRLSRARDRLRDCLQEAGELLPDQYRLKRDKTVSQEDYP